MLKLLKKITLFAAAGFLLLVAGLNVWGALTLGTLSPDPQALRDPDANRVVMVFGATGSAGDSLLKAAVDSPMVDKVYVITRRSSPRIDAGVAAGKVEMRLHRDFTDYSSLVDILPQVNTVFWALGTSSLNVDDETYTRIHVDFPMAFVRQWLALRQQGPMAFHNVTGMGTNPISNTHWAREKGRAELQLAALAEGTGLRTFGHRSGWIRPAADRANGLVYLGEWLLKPGKLVIPGVDLGLAMLEISARTGELANGTLIDNADAIAYARAARAPN